MRCNLSNFLLYDSRSVRGVIHVRNRQFLRFSSLMSFSTSIVETIIRLNRKVINVNDVTSSHLQFTRGWSQIACVVVEKSYFKDWVFHVKIGLGGNMSYCNWNKTQTEFVFYSFDFEEFLMCFLSIAFVEQKVRLRYAFFERAFVMVLDGTKLVTPTGGIAHEQRDRRWSSRKSFEDIHSCQRNPTNFVKIPFTISGRYVSCAQRYS